MKHGKTILKTIGKTLSMVLLVIAMIGCLSACGEEDSEPKKGKERDGKKNEQPTETPTPTDEPTPTGEPTPTDEPTPTPTGEPTPVEPQYSGYAADLRYLLGSWVNDKGDVFTIRSVNGTDVEIVASKWYTGDAGLQLEDGKPSVMPVLTASVNEVNDDAEIVAVYTDAQGAQHTYPFYFTDVNDFSANLRISTGITRYFKRLEEGATPLGKPYDARDFFRFYSGFWTEEDSYNFIMISISREQQFLINFSSFYSEWGPTARIISIVEGALGEGVFVQIEYDVTETETARKWYCFTIDGKGDLEIYDTVEASTVIYGKGIPYPDLANLDIPDIVYAASLCNEDAMSYLSKYNMPYLLNIWHPYLTEDVPNEKATFHEDFYGGTITLYYDASGKITRAETAQ